MFSGTPSTLAAPAGKLYSALEVEIAIELFDIGLMDRHRPDPADKAGEGGGHSQGHVKEIGRLEGPAHALAATRKPARTGLEQPPRTCREQN